MLEPDDLVVDLPDPEDLVEDLLEPEDLLDPEDVLEPALLEPEDLPEPDLVDPEESPEPDGLLEPEDLVDPEESPDPDDLLDPEDLPEPEDLLDPDELLDDDSSPPFSLAASSSELDCFFGLLSSDLCPSAYAGIPASTNRKRATTTKIESAWNPPDGLSFRTDIPTSGLMPCGVRRRGTYPGNYSVNQPASHISPIW